MGCSWTLNVSNGKDLLDHPVHLPANTMFLNSDLSNLGLKVSSTGVSTTSLKKLFHFLIHLILGQFSLNVLFYGFIPFILVIRLCIISTPLILISFRCLYIFTI